MRFILDTPHHEVISGDGVSPGDWDAEDYVNWYSECILAHCGGIQDTTHEYFLPPPGGTVDEDLVIFEALYLADKDPDYDNAQCSDFGGDGPPAGGHILFDHYVEMNIDGAGGEEFGYFGFTDPVSKPGTYTMSYSIDVSNESGGTSRFYFDGWVVVSCTAKDEL